MLDLPLQTGMGGAVLGIALVMFVILVVALFSAIEIVDPDERKALFVFGEFRDVIEPGLNVVPPFVSRTKPIPKSLQTVEVVLEDVETADGSTCSVLIRVDVRVVDARAAFTEVDNYRSAFTDVALSTTRSAVQSHEIAALRDPGQLERQIQDDLSAAVDDWGLVVPAIELELASRVPEARP